MSRVNKLSGKWLMTLISTHNTVLNLSMLCRLDLFMGMKFHLKGVMKVNTRASIQMKNMVKNMTGNLMKKWKWNLHAVQVILAISIRWVVIWHAIAPPHNRTPTQSLSQGASLPVGQIQGQLQDDSTPSASEVPAIAARFAIPSGIGKPINKQLASNIEYLTTHPLDEKNLSDTASKYPSPDNCPTLDVPKVNGTIWENLKGYTRTKDLKLQRVQKALAKGLTAFARSVDGQDLTDTQQDTLALLCNAQFELNCLRRDCIRPDINTKYTHLCKASNVLTPSKQLFGDDLSKQVKDLQEEHKAAVGVVKGGRGPPYGRERRQYKPYIPRDKSVTLP